MLIEEYGEAYGLKAIVNRCGVLTGPWQMGKVDQGFFVLWAARHLYGGSLRYMGFGGCGYQVRDVLHVADLYDLIRLEIASFDAHAGKTYNVGGGPEISVSLAELSELCVQRTGSRLEMSSDSKRQTDIHPAAVAFNRRVNKLLDTGKINDLIKSRFYLASGHPEDRAVQENIFSAG